MTGNSIPCTDGSQVTQHCEQGNGQCPAGDDSSQTYAWLFGWAHKQLHTRSLDSLAVICLHAKTVTSSNLFNRDCNKGLVTFIDHRSSRG